MNRTAKIAGLLLGLAQLAVLGSARADVSFDNMAILPSTSSPFVSDGFSFSITPLPTASFDKPPTHSVTNLSGFGASNGSNYLAYYAIGSHETFTSLANTPFSLTSIDLGGWYNFGDSPQLLTITGFRTDNTSIVTQLSISPTSFNSYLLTGFSNLRSVQLGSLDRGYVAVDNIRVAAPVPEPETYAMMLAGLGLLGFIARRRKQKAA